MIGHRAIHCHYPNFVLPSSWAIDVVFARGQPFVAELLLYSFWPPMSYLRVLDLGTEGSVSVGTGIRYYVY